MIHAHASMDSGDFSPLLLADHFLQPPSTHRNDDHPLFNNDDQQESKFKQGPSSQQMKNFTRREV